MIEMKCSLCRREVGLPGEVFHQVDEGYWCDPCTRDQAHTHWLLGGFFRWLTKRNAERRT